MKIAQEQHDKAKEAMEEAESQLEAKKEKVKEAKAEEVIKPQDVELKNEDEDKDN